MQADRATETLSYRTQFGLAAMFECVTVCAIPLAMMRVIGLGSSVLLLATALALALRQGFFALFLAMGASLAADMQVGANNSTDSLARQLVVAAVIAALAGWYKLRRQRLPRGVAA